MRNFALTALAVVMLGAGAARAADVYEKGSMKDTPVYESAPTWAGFYFGGHVGGAFNDGDDIEDKCEPYYKKDNNGSVMGISDGGQGGYERDPQRKKCRDFYYGKGEYETVQRKKGGGRGYDYDLFEGFGDDDDGELIGGVHVGYNWQWAQKVFGIEGDVSFSDGVDYLASIRGRLGFAFDNVLIYGTGGVAFLGVENDVDLPGYDGDDDTITGYVVGGGIEKKLFDTVSIGVEGLYYNFDDEEFDHEVYTYEKELDFFVVRGRLTFHVGQAAAAIEPMK